MNISNEQITDENALNSMEVKEGEIKNNVYDYLNRDDFTSEKFKIEIKGLPKFYGISEFKKLLNDKLLLDCVKIKTIRPGNPWAFVCFRNEDDRLKAIKVINGFQWKGKSLTAHEAKPAPDPFIKKRKELEAIKQPANKKSKPDITQIDKLKNSTCPYWNIPYDDQLKNKQKEIQDILKQYSYQLWKWVKPPMKLWLEKQKKLHHGYICELMDIIPSPVKEGYRNKCEFTIGIDLENNLPTVGFRLSSYEKGCIGVAPVEQLCHIPDQMKVVVKAFEIFIRKSEYTVFSPEDHSGYFRQLTVRVSNHTGELMLVVGIHPQNLSKTELDQFKEDLKTFFVSGEGKIIVVNSLYIELITKRTSGEFIPNVEHIWGATHITDMILGLKFQISPATFFQVNTKCAEVLYSKAIELSKPTSETTVLDICCGIGTIGLSFSKYCSKVIGVEIVPQAIIDAKQNAENNCIKNSDFHTGSAEDVLSSVLWATKGEKDLLAVVDPPRAGLHTRAITQLRRCTDLKRLIYVSCSPRSAIKNWVDLSRPASKTMRGAPFLPVRAVAVDMFPQTKHCELIVYFERAEDISLPSPIDNISQKQTTNNDMQTEEQMQTKKAECCAVLPDKEGENAPIQIGEEGKLDIDEEVQTVGSEENETCEPSNVQDQKEVSESLNG